MRACAVLRRLQVTQLQGSDRQALQGLAAAVGDRLGGLGALAQVGGGGWAVSSHPECSASASPAQLLPAHPPAREWQGWDGGQSIALCPLHARCICTPPTKRRVLLCRASLWPQCLARAAGSGGGPPQCVWLLWTSTRIETAHVHASQRVRARVNTLTNDHGCARARTPNGTPTHPRTYAWLQSALGRQGQHFAAVGADLAAFKSEKEADIAALQRQLAQLQEGVQGLQEVAVQHAQAVAQAGHGTLQQVRAHAWSADLCFHTFRRAGQCVERGLGSAMGFWGACVWEALAGQRGCKDKRAGAAEQIRGIGWWHNASGGRCGSEIWRAWCQSGAGQRKMNGVGMQEVRGVLLSLSGKTFHTQMHTCARAHMHTHTPVCA